MILSGPDSVDAPVIDNELLTLTINKPNEVYGDISCYYVIMFKLAGLDRLEDVRTEMLRLELYRNVKSSNEMVKLQAYVVLALPAFEESSKTFFLQSENLEATTSCGVCQNVSNSQILTGSYLVTIGAAAFPVNHTSDTCGHDYVRALI